MLNLTFCCSFFSSLLHIFLMWFYSPNINHACGGSVLQTASSLCHTRSPLVVWWGFHIKQCCDSGGCTLYPGKYELHSLSTHNGLCAEKAFCCSHCIFRVYLNSCWQTFCFSFCEKQSTQKWQIICANHWAIPLFMQRGFGWSFLQTEAVWAVL